ncbi:MAG: PadR family transcriptional regulator [Gemmatimonadetes bacterium]|nr:PadR family transcriptional regulator [Gemmatimonadota bacterium]
MRDTPLSPIPGTLELLILRTLGAGSEMHGFAILEWIHQSTDDALIVEDGALYHALHRMERRRWVDSDWGISEKGRRARYYRISPEGRRVLAAEEERWSRYVEAVGKIAPREAGT